MIDRLTIHLCLYPLDLPLKCFLLFFDKFFLYVTWHRLNHHYREWQVLQVLNLQVFSVFLVCLWLHMRLVSGTLRYYLLAEAAVAYLQILGLQEINQSIWILRLQTDCLLGVLDLECLNVVNQELSEKLIFHNVNPVWKVIWLSNLLMQKQRILENPRTCAHYHMQPHKR